jgi:hypothetical protein
VNIVTGIDAAAVRQDIGRFSVATDPGRVAAFRESIALAGGLGTTGVPLTFPLSWWMEDEVKGAIVAAMNMNPFDRDAALVHLDQSIDTHRPLEEGARYWLELTLVGPTPDQRFRVEARVLDAGEAEVAFLAGGFVRARLDRR